MIQNLPEEELFEHGHAACAGCGAAIAMRMILKASGKNAIVSHATGCMEVVSSAYPLTAWKVPWIHSAFENAAATASGIEAALKAMKKEKEINVIAIGGDGGTFDIGLQALSGAIERGHDFCYICYDNEAYMNTGIQRSSATPKFTATTTSPAGKSIHGKMQWKKRMPFIIAGHNENVYVATANIAYPQDFVNKVKKGIAHKGPAYIQVLTPCTPGWKIPDNISIQVAKAAQRTGIYPLYEIEKGILTITMKSPKAPVEEYLKMQGRFSHLNKEETAEIQKHINEDWKNLIELERTKIKIP